MSFRASVFPSFCWNKVVANRKQHDMSAGKKKAFPEQIGDGKVLNVKENYCACF